MDIIAYNPSINAYLCRDHGISFVILDYYTRDTV